MAALSAIRVSPDKLRVTLVYGETEDTLSAEFLRVFSPSAEVRGHGGEPPKLVSNVGDVTVTDIEPVGRYALKFVFSDGHDTGLYTFDYLGQLIAEREERWATHLARLKAEGAAR